MMRRTFLAWRLYLIGSIQLLVLGAAIAGVGWILRPMFPRPPHRRAPPPQATIDQPMPPPPVRPMFWAPLATFFASGLAIVGVGSFLTARWIVRPLGTLSRTAERLGAGDLKARANLGRQDEIGGLGRAFDDMAERVESLLRAERELLANVSHELRTPLARIRVALEMADEAGAGSAQAPLAEIRSDLAELETIIDDIITAAHFDLDDGRSPPSSFPIHRERTTAPELCSRAIDRFRSRHPDRPLELALKATPPVDADPVLLRRVLDNLLENAHKYTPDPSRPIQIRTLSENGRVSFEVVDRGIGIPKEDLPRVFVPFFRSERSRTRSAGGVGLGLTLAKRIVEAHGGAIEIASEAGAGTTVHVMLPVADLAAPAEPSHAS
jgi:signal transduction histidine kinase